MWEDGLDGSVLLAWEVCDRQFSQAQFLSSPLRGTALHPLFLSFTSCYQCSKKFKRTLCSAEKGH